MKNNNATQNNTHFVNLRRMFRKLFFKLLVSLFLEVCVSLKVFIQSKLPFTLPLFWKSVKNAFFRLASKLLYT